MPCIAMVSIITVEGEMYEKQSIHVYVQCSVTKLTHCSFNYALLSIWCMQ